MRKVLSVLIIFSLLMMAGCYQQDKNNEKIGIRGIVKDINIGKGRGSLLVEGSLEKDTLYDKAFVNVNVNTKIQKGNSNKLFRISDIKIGDTVEVLFKGAVAESYPVQGTGEIIRIIRGK